MHRIALLFLALLTSLVSAAQNYQFYAADQLSSSLITDIEQDANGLIWIGTEHGLNRFDGYKFIYRTSLTNEEDNHSTIVTSLLSDKEQRLWVGTARGLVLFDRATSRFTEVQFPGGNLPRVSSLLQLSDGTLLAGTSGYGLYKIDTESMQANILLDYAPQDENSYFNHTFQSSDGCFWANGVNDRIVFRQKQGHVSAFSSQYGSVVSFFELAGKTYALCQHGLIQIDAKRGVTPYPAPSTSLYYTCSATDSQGNLYIGTRGNGLYWIPKGKQEAQRFQLMVNAFDLNHARIESIFVDQQGNLWIGCHQKGLLMVPLHRRPLFQTWDFATQRHETGTYVSSIAMGKDSTIWCTVQGDGIYGFNHEGRITAHPQSPQGVEMLFRDRDSQYWLGTTDALWRYYPESGQADLVTQIQGDRVNAMAELNNGNLAISVFGAGLYIINKSQGKLVRKLTMYDTDTVGRGRLANDWIYSLDTDRSGKLWIGTSSGICCYDPSSRSFRKNGWNVLAEREACTALRILKNGDVLLATEKGLQRWTTEKQLIPESGTEDLNGLTINYIAEDAKEELWFSTNNGIWHWQPKQKRLVAFVSSNGLQAREFVLGSGLQTVDGRILLGTAEGITSFQPDSLRISHPTTAKIHLTGMTISGQRANADTRSNGLQVMNSPLNTCHHFHLSYVDASFQLEFSLLDFADASDIIFEYRIDGESHWQATERGQNTISFSHMAPGRYKLQVRALQAGSYTDVENYIVEIHPPWWRSNFAYLLYALLLIVLLVYATLGYRQRMRRQLDEDKMQFLINATHDIRSPLTLILSPLEKLRSHASDDTSRAELDIIHRNAQRILDLVNQILDIRKIDKQQMKLHPVDVDFTALFGAICHMHDFAAREHNITLRFLHPDDPIHATADPQQIEKVLANLLSNAFKFTPDGGEITVELTTQDSNIQFTVTDTGPGVAPAAIPHIFDRFYQSNQSGSKPGTGIGLHLCRMILEMHGGNITVQNRTDGQSGCRFIVNLPVNSELKPYKTEEQPAVAPNVTKAEGNTILIVDDDTELSAYVARELSSHYRCITAANGREALQTLLTAPEGSISAVISDVMMPEMDGFTLLRLIKTNPRVAHLPVVMLTSKTDIASRLEGLDRGADAYLAKPFTTAEVAATLHNLLAQRQLLHGKFSGAQQAGVERAEIPEQRGNDELLMDRIMESINKHLADSDFSVDQLCAEAGISRAHLHRKMKEMTGLPITEFIRNIRLEQAARLLREQKLNITQVAYTVGFSNLGYFSTVFRKHFGIAPRDYIQQPSNES